MDGMLLLSLLLKRPATEFEQNQTFSRKRFRLMMTTEQPIVPGNNEEPRPTTNGEIESLVLHLRRLPPDVCEAEVASLAVPFGGLNNMVLSKKNGQALIEMPSLEAAKMMLRFYSQVAPPFLRSPHVAVQFSRYQNLSTNGGSTQLYAAINQANEAALASTEAGPRSVLRVVVECYPHQLQLSHVLFHQLFSRFGVIKRIIAFMGKRGAGSPHVILQPQALIEFENPVSAHVAKIQMHQSVFSHFGGQLLVDFSRQSHLEVRHENTLCRDYTTKPMTDVELLGLGIAAIPADLQATFHHPHQGILPLMSQHTIPPNNANDRYILPGNASPVLIVSQLNAEKVTPDALFNLFGVYGDVLRVKVMFSKRDTALVQFVDASQAVLALENLNGCPLFGHTLQCNFSRHLHIKMPPPSTAAEDCATTKDYSDCGLNRFRRVRNNAVFAPSPVLHVSGINGQCTEEEIIDAFKEDKCEPLQGKLLQKEERRMVLLQFPSLDAAITALVTMHNKQIPCQQNPSSLHRIRVCFSRIQLPPLPSDASQDKSIENHEHEEPQQIQPAEEKQEEKTTVEAEVNKEEKDL
ncbi:Polypyrimidine tract-binding protein 1 [Cichlidogyrus casuarinus]|uniref:Polypyrimidine tract-binding protein 1 n=1 Tax=Cichlidogyrus casuarinus TaxID=1844966 RepID=A0ABD2Q9J1_9PLAT